MLDAKPGHESGFVLFDRLFTIILAKKAKMGAGTMDGGWLGPLK